MGTGSLTVPLSDIVDGEFVAPVLTILAVPLYVPTATPVKRTEIVFETLAAE